MSPDHTHEAGARSWVASADTDPEFPIQNLPLGVFSVEGGGHRIGTRIGDQVLDLRALAAVSLLPATLAPALAQPTLNALFSLPAAERRALRHAVFELLTATRARGLVEPHLLPAGATTMHLPFRIGDYTDFYTGIHHATRVGQLFRPEAPLLPNYKHVPIAYHGRASSVRVSGTSVLRPCGQSRHPDEAQPRFVPSTQLDHEVELGIWIAGHNEIGTPVAIAEAWERVGGFTLLNDWSARDLQAWEYQPLGPFLAKNFLTSVSPWIITREALLPFLVAPAPRPPGDPEPLPYLRDAADQRNGAVAITLSATLSTAAMRSAGLPALPVSEVDAAEAMYWTVAQMIAHHSSNGCDLHAGDLLGTGTLSGPTPGSHGCLMELSEGGRHAMVLPDGDTRHFLADGDEVILNARAERVGFRSIGFGECRGRVLPARSR